MTDPTDANVGTDGNAPADGLTVVHRNVPLLEVADSFLMDQILSDPGAAQLVVLRLSPCVAVIAPDGFDKLAARLRKIGHLPKVVAG